MKKTPFRPYSPNQMTLFPHRIDEDIPQDDPVRIVSSIVDSLSLTQFMKLYSKEGRKSYHPKMMLKVILYAYMNNTFSCRKIENLLKRDIYYMWLAGGEKPDFITINRFRNRMKKEIGHVFTQLVLKLSEYGLLSLDVEYIDGTKIESKANKYTFVWRKNIERNTKRLKEKILVLLSQIDDSIAQDNAVVTEGVEIDSSILSEIIEKLKKDLEDIKKEDKGDKGDKEDKGDKGDKEDKGDKGDKEDKGDKGDKEDKGDKGDKEDKGDKGDKGDKRDKGDKGDKGDKRDKGDKGDKGDTNDNDNKEDKDGKKELSQKMSIIRDLEKKAKKLKEYEESSKILGDRNSYSKTDKDATFMHMKEDAMMNGQTKPGYNLQIGTNNQFIIDFGLYSNRADSLTTPSFLESYRNKYGQLPRTVVADSGYGSEENYRYMEENNVEAQVKYNYFHREQRPSYVPNPYAAENLPYNEKSNYLICPNGKKARYIKTDYKTTASGYVTEFDVYSPRSCRGCPLRSECCKGRGNRTFALNHRLIEYKRRARERLTSPQGIYYRGRRCIEPEAVFGQMKYNMGYNRFRHTGKDKVTMDFAFFAMAFNIKKLCKRVKNGGWRPFFDFISCLAEEIMRSIESFFALNYQYCQVRVI